MPAPSNLVRLPARRHTRTPAPESAAGSPGKVIRLPAARPAPTPRRGPTSPAAANRNPRPAYCAAGNTCVAYQRLGSPAKLSRHNQARVGGERYCYACRERIADERTRSTAHRQASEAAAAGALAPQASAQTSGAEAP